MSYHYDDQTGLARTLAYMCDLHLGALASGERASAMLPLRFGSGIAFVPGMGIYVSGGNPRGAPPLRLLPTPPTALFSYSDLVGHGAPVGISHALRQKAARPSRPHADITELLGGMNALSTPTAHLEPLGFSVPREAINLGPTGFARAVMGHVRAHEDELCFTELARLPHHDRPLECNEESLDAKELREFVDVMEAGRPPDSRLDTVLLGASRFASLARNHGDIPDARTPHSNVLQALGLTIVGNGLIPDGEAYVVSSRHGPAFVHGPTVIRCGGAELAIAHYCGMEAAVELPAPGVPVGFHVSLVRAPPGRREGEPVRGRPAATAEASEGARDNPAKSLAGAAHDLYLLGRYDKARLVLEEAGRVGLDVAACLLWERALAYLGTDGGDRVASHNDLLCGIDALIVSGFPDGKLLRARERVMLRLGIPRAMIDSTLDALLEQMDAAP